MDNAPAGQKEISPPITRDEPRHRRMIFFTEAHDDVAERCDPLAIEVEDRSTQHLGQIKHLFDFTPLRVSVG